MDRIVIKKLRVIGTRGYRYLLKCNQCKKEFECGGSNYNKGKGLFCSRLCRSSNREWLEKISNILKKGFKNGRIHPRGMKGKVAWNKGKENKYWKGSKNPNWNNGSSFIDYGKEFDKRLKRKIRSRDDFTCRLCRKTEKELKRRLDVHHIDYDKKNNRKINLISLCHGCHMKTNPKKNREYYSKILNKMNYDICWTLDINKTSEVKDKKLLR